MDASVKVPARAKAARRERGPSGLFLRRLHGWAGAFFAPGILFFAATGLLQVFDLHKVQAERGYTPPPVVLAIAQLHKSQRLQTRKPRAPDAASPAAAKRNRKTDSAPAPMGLAQQLLKVYAAALSVALAVTALVGLWLALRNRRDRTVSLVLLLAGVLVPAGLLLLG